MPVFRLDARLVFPPVHLAEDGLLAIGGDLSPERLLLAYSQGIFPWYSRSTPILWHSPDPRMVMTPTQLTINRSLRKQIRRRPYELRMDTAFVDVMRGCADTPRPDQAGTWLVPDMVAAYTRLHELGFAHSIEAWKDGALVGGLYGVSLGAAFFGESMFARAPDASKIAYVAAIRQLAAWGVSLIDCQVHTHHLERFGAHEVSREIYMRMLHVALDEPTLRGAWRFALDLDDPDALLAGAAPDPLERDEAGRS